MYNNVYIRFGRCGTSWNLSKNNLTQQENSMSGKVLSASTGAVGVALLPNTGSPRPLFVMAAILLAGGLITLAIGLIRKTEA